MNDHQLHLEESNKRGFVHFLTLSILLSSEVRGYFRLRFLTKSIEFHQKPGDKEKDLSPG
jgi:hypothetical protein